MILRDRSIFVMLYVLVVDLGPIQFGFTCGYSSQLNLISLVILHSVSDFSLFGSLSNVGDGNQPHLKGFNWIWLASVFLVEYLL